MQGFLTAVLHNVICTWKTWKALVLVLNIRLIFEPTGQAEQQKNQTTAINIKKKKSKFIQLINKASFVFHFKNMSISQNSKIESSIRLPTARNL